MNLKVTMLRYLLKSWFIQYLSMQELSLLGRITPMNIEDGDNHIKIESRKIEMVIQSGSIPCGCLYNPFLEDPIEILNVSMDHYDTMSRGIISIIVVSDNYNREVRYEGDSCYHVITRKTTITLKRINDNRYSGTIFYRVREDNDSWDMGPTEYIDVIRLQNNVIVTVLKGEEYTSIKTSNRETYYSWSLDKLTDNMKEALSIITSH